MACDACAIKFSFFKRKKQCMDCLRYFCTECVIRRFDGIQSCDNCSMLSRRPLIRSQILQMRSKYLQHYLLAKKVSIRGCIEKEDLVNLLISFANGDDGIQNRARSEHASQNEANDIQSESSEMPSNHVERPENRDSSPTRRSRSPQINEIPTPEEVHDLSTNRHPVTSYNDIEIEEVTESDDNLNGGPQPVITEQDVSEPAHTEEHTETFSLTQTWTGRIKLSDIKELSNLECLSAKQLKDLLSANRVDFKGCVERCELLDRACRLWEEYRKSQKVIETEDEDALCKICLDAPIECVILECGHMACCINCGKQMSDCPICRQYVVRVVRFFKA